MVDAADPSTGPGTCALCHLPLSAEEAVAVCPDCGAHHHGACWQEHGECSTFGCHALLPLGAEEEPPAADPSPAGVPPDGPPADALRRRPLLLLAPGLLLLTGVAVGVVCYLPHADRPPKAAGGSRPAEQATVRFDIPQNGGWLEVPAAWPKRTKSISSEGYYATRMLWECPGATDVAVCVERGLVPNNNSDEGWGSLHNRLAQRYGSRYVCHQLGEVTQHGARLYRWDYTVRSARTGRATRVNKIGTAVAGYGVAVWGECPDGEWDRWRETLERAVYSYHRQ